MLGMLLSTLDIQLVEEDELNEIDETKPIQQQPVPTGDDCRNPQSQPVFIVLTHLMPVLDDVVNKWSSDSSIIQVCILSFCR